MCGICGILGNEDAILVKKMCDTLSHRGPDDSGIYSDDGIVLGHRRLSIIDIKGGHQPMSNEDESIWIVFNGEIYNHLELRNDLEKRGHSFSTRSDTESIIHAYEEYGENCVELLRGEFAFAIWDGEQKKLVLARDRMGIKPLFYANVGDEFVFASEIKAILQHHKIIPTLCLQSLHYLLSLRSIPGALTMFEGVCSLTPGHVLIYHNKQIKIKQYWDLPSQVNSEKSEDFYVNNIKSLFENSVKRRLMSDVPTGVLLSGGIDSSSIVAVMSKFVDEPINTFTVGFGEATDETGSAQLIADHFNTNHRSIVVDVPEVVDLLPKIIYHADSPMINLPQNYIIHELVSKNVKVVSGGTGGDELFGGYVRYKYLNKVGACNGIASHVLKSKVVKKVISPAFHIQKNINSPLLYEYKRRIQFMYELNDNMKLYLLTRNALTIEDEYDKVYSKKTTDKHINSVTNIFNPFFKTNDDLLRQVLIAELKTKLTDDLLLSEDRMSMAHSIELRVPFLDTDLVEFAFSIPSHMKIKNGVTKYIFKKAMSDILPKPILKKPKWGFAFTPSSLYEQGLKEHAEILLSKESVEKRGLFNYEYIRKILDYPTTSKLRWHYYFIMNLVALEVWHRIYIDQDNIRKPKLEL